MRGAIVALALVACSGELGDLTTLPAPRPVADTFVKFSGETVIHDAAVLPGGDVVVVGCARDGVALTFVARLAEATRLPIWTQRSASPCGFVDNWTPPRVAVTASGTIWIATQGWGHGQNARDAPVGLLAFAAADGALGTMHELAPGERVRALLAVGGERIAIAGQSAAIRDRSSAHVSVLDAHATTVWRTPIANPHVVKLESLALGKPGTLLVGGETDGAAQDHREAVGIVHTLALADGAIAGTWTKRIPRTNITDVFVATAGDGTAYVLYKQGEWAPSPRHGALIVEPLAERPAWRRVLAGTDPVTPDGFAVSRTGDRVAVVAAIQGGELDLGRGPIRSTMFDRAGYVELSTLDGSTTDARALAAGPEETAFFRDVVWDGAAFFATGEADDQAVAWRVGVTITAARSPSP